MSDSHRGLLRLGSRQLRKKPPSSDGCGNKRSKRRIPRSTRFLCNSLDSTLRTALASFYVSDTEGIRLGDFECNDSITMSAPRPE